MASEEFAWLACEGDALRVVSASHRIGATMGRWSRIESLTDSDARRLSERIPVPVVHCTVHTTVNLAQVQAFVGGRCVRQILSTADTEWTASGKALPFEDRAALRSLARLRNAGQSVDPYLVIDSFLGMAPTRVAAPKKRAKAKDGRTRERGVVVMPGASGEEDEDCFKPPASWVDAIDRRRGGWFTEAPLAPDATVAFEQARRAFAPVAEHWRLDPRRVEFPELRDRMESVKARFAQAGTPSVASIPEEAAAALMSRLAFEPPTKYYLRHAPLVDFWVASRDLTFAVECALSAFAIAAGGLPWHLRPAGGGQALKHGPGLAVLRSVRRHLASADDASYERARVRCAELRVPALETPHMQVRAAASYLFPSEIGWYEEVAAEHQRKFVGHEAYPWRYASAPAMSFAPNVTFDEGGLVHVPAMVERFGRGLEEHLGREIGYCLSTRRPGNRDGVQRLAEALASIPTDAAMQVLAKGQSDKIVRRQLDVATSSYPARAARLGLA